MIPWMCDIDGACQWIDVHNLYAIIALVCALSAIGLGAFIDWIRHAEKKYPADRDDFRPPF